MKSLLNQLYTSERSENPSGRIQSHEDMDVDTGRLADSTASVDTQQQQRAISLISVFPKAFETSLEHIRTTAADNMTFSRQHNSVCETMISIQLYLKVS